MAILCAELFVCESGKVREREREIQSERKKSAKERKGRGDKLWVWGACFGQKRNKLNEKKKTRNKFPQARDPNL